MNTIKRVTMMIPTAALAATFAMGATASALGHDVLARFDGGIGVLPVASVVGPQNADTSFPNVAANTVRGVAPSGSPWRIDDLKADIDIDGRIKVRGKGLRLAGGDKIGQSLLLHVGATLICEASAPFVQRSTVGLVQLDANGDFRIDDTLNLVTTECASPVLLIRTNGNGTWLAAGIPVDVD